MIPRAVPHGNSSDFEASSLQSLLVNPNPFWALIEKDIKIFSREARDWIQVPWGAALERREGTDGDEWGISYGDSRQGQGKSRDRHRNPHPQQNNIRELGQKGKFTEESPSWKSVLTHLKTLLTQSTWEIKVDSRLYPATQGIYESSGLSNPCSF